MIARQPLHRRQSGASAAFAWAHDGGFSVDGSVHIEGADRTGLVRLMRCCARPPFVLEHLHQRDADHLVYRNPKPARTTAPVARPTALVLKPREHRRPSATAACASRSLLGCARAQCTAAVCGDGARPCRRPATRPPRPAPARGPPLWAAAAAAEQAGNDPQGDSSEEPAPEIESDQRIAW